MIFLFWQVKLLSSCEFLLFYFFYSTYHLGISPLFSLLLDPSKSINSPKNNKNNSQQFESCDGTSDTEKFLSPDPWSDEFVGRTNILQDNDTETYNQETNKEIHKKKLKYSLKYTQCRFFTRHS